MKTLRSLSLLLLCLGLLVGAVPVSADSHEAPDSAAAETANGCPALTAAKYPFLSCGPDGTLSSKGVRPDGVRPAVPEFKAWAWSDPSDQ